MVPIFLTLDEVINVHIDQIKRYGGTIGVSDIGLLQSALAMPQSSYGGQYLHESLYEMAGAYLFHIVMNHPFIDGNKRSGVAAANVFLIMNKIDINADEEELEAMVRLIAEGKLGKKDAADFFKRNHAP